MAAGRRADPAELFRAARAGDHGALARLLSLVERGGPAARRVAALAYRAPGDAYTVGVTGAPGAGKSTLTDRLVTEARARGLGGDAPRAGRVAVLAVDPSSPFTGGAILGDRVRMGSHALDEDVFIRSMATKGHLGGLTVAVPDAIRVLSSVGVPVVMVETVGVGQIEVEVASATDTTVVVVNPGWGDAVQANKAGLLEIADLFVVNKADRPGAAETRRDLELMLDLSALGEWRPPIVETIASTGEGADAVWSAVTDHRAYLRERGLLEGMQRDRLEREFQRILVARVERRLDELKAADGYVDLLDELLEGRMDPYDAADRLLEEIAGTEGPEGGPG